MEAVDHIKIKVAKSLLSQRDSKQRKRQVLGYIVTLIVLLFVHSYFSNLASPLKLIPRTMTAIGMGYVILSILSLRRFIYLTDFIDWEKVTKSVEQGGEPNP